MVKVILWFFTDHMGRIPDDLRPQRLFDFKSILPMAATELYNIDKVKDTLRQVIEEEYADPTEEQYGNLCSSIKFSNSEAADTIVT